MLGLIRNAQIYGDIVGRTLGAWLQETRHVFPSGHIVQTVSTCRSSRGSLEDLVATLYRGYVRFLSRPTMKDPRHHSRSVRWYDPLQLIPLPMLQGNMRQLCFVART